MDKRGTLIISLDFEMMWGTMTFSTPETYGASHIANVPTVIQKLLERFRGSGIHATFAVVGMIGYKDKFELLADIPNSRPTYLNDAMSPYSRKYIESIKDKDSALYFAPELIRAIKGTEGMEIATHTFCHYYCQEPGQTLEQFRSDLQKAIQRGRAWGVDIKSIIFPCNEVDSDYIRICGQEGISAYRGNPDHFFGKKNNLAGIYLNKVCRLIDNYVNLGGSTSFTTAESKETGVVNVQASRFLRPYNKRLTLFEGLRLRRIKKEMTNAARKGEAYHLWWHPHNFGFNMNENFRFLDAILRHYETLRNQYNMKSLNMYEFANGK